jgi:signal peptidase I
MKLRQLILILLAGILLAAFIKITALETFRIASSSLEGNCYPGDRILVEKWTIGSRLPQAVRIPFTKKKSGTYEYWNLLTEPFRLPSLSSLKYNDLVVFNDPRDTLQAIISWKPILISRCVGLPGELVQLKGKQLYINNREKVRFIESRFCYRYSLQQKSSLDSIGARSLLTHQETYQKGDSIYLFLPDYLYFKLLAKNNKLFSSLLQPHVTSYDCQQILLPYKGYQIELNPFSFEQWHRLINQYEGVSLTSDSKSSYFINGKASKRYTFRQNYYFVLNDHQGFINDSRTIGLIPEDYLIGKAWMVFYSPVTKRFLQQL